MFFLELLSLAMDKFVELVLLNEGGGLTALLGGFLKSVVLLESMVDDGTARG